MDYKEKYEMALEGIQEILGSGEDSIKMSRLQLRLQGIFPELKESEDERTWIINYLSNRILNSTIIAEKENLKKAIAWLEKQAEHAKFCDSIQVGNKVTRNRDGMLVNLSKLKRVAKPTEEYNITGIGSKNAQGKLGEMIKRKLKMEKQGEQKPADKVEPKFKAGDWVVIDGEVLHIKEMTEDGYFTDEGGLIPFRNEKEAHIWTIQDTKTGNVLACESGWTCIFKTLVNDETFSSYCFMDNTKWFCETGSECHTLKDEFIKAYNGKIYPATKEQRDLLFKKMKEAGYEWDAEKKELKKIEQKPAEIEKGVKGNDREIPDSAWSEDDETYSDHIITAWKPSEEQITVLHDVAAYIDNSLYPNQKDILVNLYLQLKKLKQ